MIITPYDKKYVKKEFDEFIRETGYTFGLTHLNDGGITELEELYGECANKSFTKPFNLKGFVNFKPKKETLSSIGLEHKAIITFKFTATQLIPYIKEILGIKEEEFRLIFGDNHSMTVIKDKIFTTTSTPNTSIKTYSINNANTGVFASKNGSDVITLKDYVSLDNFLYPIVNIIPYCMFKGEILMICLECSSLV